jgi:hypothetical protein
MITASGLGVAEASIVERFVRQCKEGAQSRNLPEDVKACGQFLGTGSPQRGLHGTAAALRVLGPNTTPDAQSLVSQMIKYVAERHAAEMAAGSSATVLEQVVQDNANVIKQSELLYALTFIPSGIASTESSQQLIADRLIEGKLGEEGWDYYVDNNRSSVESLPTAFAVRALHGVGKKQGRAVEFLLSEVRSATKPRGVEPKRADVSVYVFCLYVLTFGHDGAPLAAESELKKVFTALWRSLEPQLDFEVEQNIEYMRDGAHQYVRVPWQIHLLALAARWAPHRFASKRAQGQLSRIILALESREGFLYPHSGKLASARTNAILYDSLKQITPQVEKYSWLLRPYYLWDAFMRALSSSMVLWALRVSALVLIGLALFDWWISGANWDGIAQEMLASSLLLVVTWRRSR